MAGRDEKSITLLRPEQEKEQKKAYERMPGEPAKWFLRFQIYCQLGRGRTLEQVVYLDRYAPQEPSDTKGLADKEQLGTQSGKAKKTREQQRLDDTRGFVEHTREQWAKEAKTREQAQELKITVGGDWKRACARWKWVDRAAVWDNDLRDRLQRNLIAFLDHEGLYITKGQRLNALDTLACSLMTALLDDKLVGKNFKHYLAVCRELQNVLRDIKKEMASVDLNILGKE